MIAAPIVCSPIRLFGCAGSKYLDEQDVNIRKVGMCWLWSNMFSRTRAKCFPSHTGRTGSVRSSKRTAADTFCNKYRYQFVNKWGRVRPNSDIALAVRGVCRLVKTIKCRKAGTHKQRTCSVKKTAFLEAVQVDRCGRFNTKTGRWIRLKCNKWLTFSTKAPWGSKRKKVLPPKKTDRRYNWLLKVTWHG